MKSIKTLVVILMATMFVFITPFSIYAKPITKSPSPVVYINNEQATLSAPPLLKKETPLIPALDLADALGLGLTIDPENGDLHLFGNTGELRLPMNDDTAYLNDLPKELICPAQTIDNIIYLPLMFVAHSMGAEVRWDDKNLTAFVYYPEIESRGKLTVNVVDKTTGILIPKALVTVLETGEISYTNEKGTSKIFILDVTKNHPKSYYCIKPPDEIFELYSLCITAKGYEPTTYRHLALKGGENIKLNIELDPLGSPKKIDATNETAQNQIFFTGINNLPKGHNLTEWVDKTKFNTGVFRKDTPDYRNYLITLGEKSTGGYHVKIRDVACFPDKWIVETEFSSPAFDDIVTQAITYPSETISLPLDNKPVIFRLKENGRYIYLPINTLPYLGF